MSSSIFGPVPSRRLGRSLGIDLIPFKTCTYDCIYCQLGRTTCKTMQQKEWVPIDAVVKQLPEKLVVKPDYITLGGSGEPTLFSRLGELIERIKSLTDIPIAVLTNGSLLSQPDVRRGLLQADVVIPSLDVADEVMFRRVNRPVASISFPRMLGGLVDFRAEYSGRYWLEVFIVGGYTDAPSEIEKLSRRVAEIAPDRVQLNTVTRPPAETGATAVCPERLAEIAAALTPPAEIIAHFRKVHHQTEFTTGRDEVEQLLRRRPCTVSDMAAGLGMHRNEVVKYLGELEAEDRLESSRIAGNRYYRLPGS